MTVLSIPMGYYLDISGTTSEVKAEMVAQRVTKVEGYFVDVATGNRYILARKQ
jgi:hypothetical protein